MRITEQALDITEAPNADMFALWRAVFGMVLVDDDFSKEEEATLNNVMDVFAFSEGQRDVIAKDIKVPSDIVKLFKDIESLQYRKQFFILARIVAWCDGFFHDDEKHALEAVEQSLNNPQDYESELRFLMRKPAVPDGLIGENDEERMMQHVVLLMAEFYKGGDETL
ncbi:MAG: hypothetical protein AB8B83_01830 [Bdellovibrionales bacterium]